MQETLDRKVKKQLSLDDKADVFGCRRGRCQEALVVVGRRKSVRRAPPLASVVVKHPSNSFIVFVCATCNI